MSLNPGRVPFSAVLGVVPANYGVVPGKLRGAVPANYGGVPGKLRGAVRGAWKFTGRGAR